MASGRRNIFCAIERIEDGRAVISIQSYDRTPVFGIVPCSSLEVYLPDPRQRLFPVTVLDEFMGRALIEWDVECACPGNCPGDMFLVQQTDLL